MSRSMVFFGQPIFSQMIGLLNAGKINDRATSHRSDYYCKRFSTFQHLITMIYGVTSGYNSLRELCCGIVIPIILQNTPYNSFFIRNSYQPHNSNPVRQEIPLPVK